MKYADARVGTRVAIVHRSFAGEETQRGVIISSHLWSFLDPGEEPVRIPSLCMTTYTHKVWGRPGALLTPNAYMLVERFPPEVNHPICRLVRLCDLRDLTPTAVSTANEK